LTKQACSKSQGSLAINAMILRNPYKNGLNIFPNSSQSNPNRYQNANQPNHYVQSPKSNQITMKSSPEIINISSDSSSENNTPFKTYVPPFRPPHNGCRTKEQARKRKHDLPIFKDLLKLNQTPSTSRGKAVMSPKSPSSSSSEDPAWIPVRPPSPMHHLVSPFIYTSSDEDEPPNEPPSTPERPQSSRPRPKKSSKTKKTNPHLPKEREIVLGLPCPRK
jgi:hypothetical protein